MEAGLSLGSNLGDRVTHLEQATAAAAGEKSSWQMDHARRKKTLWSAWPQTFLASAIGTARWLDRTSPAAHDRQFANV